MIKGIDIASTVQPDFEEISKGRYRYYANKRTENIEGEVAFIADYFEGKYSNGSAIDFIRQCKKQEILDYDSSDNVNRCILDGHIVWFDKLTRASLMMRITAAKTFGEESITLWSNGASIIMPAVDAEEFLIALENYASQCFNVTQNHLLQIELFGQEDELFNFDVTQGYPEIVNY